MKKVYKILDELVRIK